jgi:hypothetical protein
MNADNRRTIDTLLDDLKERLAQPGTSLLPLLTVMSRFSRYSLANQMLIYAQRPTATHLMGYRSWLNAGYQVRKGEHGIAIYAPMLFRSRSDTDTRAVMLAGAYGRGVAQDLRGHLATHPDAVAVELTGPGGRLGEGMRIAELIEERNLITIVRERCASACTFAFAGGRERIVEGAGRLGFHASGSPSVLLEWLKDTTDEDAFLSKRGLSAKFIARANAVSADDIWYPTHDELLAAGVVTSIRSPP